MNNEQRDALFGPGARYSEHKEGEFIRFSEGGQEKQGKILHVRAPGPAIIGGKDHGMLYIVDTGHGFPSAIKPAQVLLGPVNACLASYGYPDSSLKDREEADNLAANVKGQVIEQHGGPRLRVLSAYIEGDDVQGRVIATVEVVEEES